MLFKNVCSYVYYTIDDYMEESYNYMEDYMEES